MRSSELRRLISATALLLVPAVVHAQESRPVTLSYDGAPLSRVVTALASFSRQSVTVSPVVGDPAISGSVQGLPWGAALDQLLAANALVARPDSTGGLRIEPERRITVEYQQASLRRVLDGIAQFGGHEIAIAPEVGDPMVTASINDVDWQRALERIVATTGLAVRADQSGGFRVSR